MVFQIVPIQPNPREKYQKQVENLCQFLMGEGGISYRVPVFRLLGITGKGFLKKGLGSFREHPEAKMFLRNHPADIIALNIMNELDKIYGENPDEIDHLRGAVGEVLSYYVCRKVHPRAGIEVRVRINKWTSGSIDTAGCSNERGHCLQSKYSLQDLGSIVEQQRDLDKIEKNTNGKAQGAFVTYGYRTMFEMRLRNIGEDASKYKVFDRADLLVLEKRLEAFSPVS